MKVIAVLTPTRERPERALKMLQSVKYNCAEPMYIDMLFYVDSDDPKLKDYQQIFKDDTLIIGPRKPVGACWNEMAQLTDASILMMGNDDQVFQTKGWDVLVREKDKEYPDGIYVFYPDDMSGNYQCTFPIVSRKWIDTLGYFFPEIFEFLANDTYAKEVGEKIGRLIYMPGFQVNHEHFAFGKSKPDETYMHWRRTGATRRDVTLLGMNKKRIEDDAAKLQKLIVQK